MCLVLCFEAHHMKENLEKWLMTLLLVCLRNIDLLYNQVIQPVY